MKKIKKLCFILAGLVSMTIGVSVSVSCTNTAQNSDKGTTEPKESTNAENPNKSKEPGTPSGTPSENTSDGIYNYDMSNTYYASLDGLKGRELREKLRKMQGENALKQTHGYRDLPDFYDQHFRDKFYNKDNSIVDVYSETDGIDPYKYENYTRGLSSANEEGIGLNREHIIPQSWFSRSPIPRSDMHLVWPSDIYVNAKRSNFYHDNVTANVVETFKNGAKLGFNSLGTQVFEPNDLFKGDIARAYFYFAFTYVDVVNSRKNNSFFETMEPYIPAHYLETYINWDKTDSVDEFNISINNEISKFNKSVRNPFVDYPNIFENLFGDNPKPFVNRGVLVSIKK